MEIARIFESGKNQVVHLPEGFRFNADEVIVQQLGEALILVSRERLWRTFMDGLEGFTSDIFEGGRNQGV